MVKPRQPVYSWRNGRQRQSHSILWFKPCPVLILQERQCRKTALTQVGIWEGQKTPHCFCSNSGNSVWQLIQNLSHMKIMQHPLHVLKAWHSKKRDASPYADIVLTASWLHLTVMLNTLNTVVPPLLLCLSSLQIRI